MWMGYAMKENGGRIVFVVRTKTSYIRSFVYSLSSNSLDTFDFTCLYHPSYFRLPGFHPAGNGKMTYPDNSVFEGTFRDDKRMTGNLTLADGTIRKYKNGKLQKNSK